MKREDKNKLCREKIINGALEEFAVKSYAEASMNSVAERGGISKGIIYHYFKNKDELYPACLKICFDSLAEKIRRECGEEGDYDERMARYMNCRNNFFSSDSRFYNLFYFGVLEPSEHLKDRVDEIKKPLDESNKKVISDFLKSTEIKDNVSIEEALEYCTVFQQAMDTCMRKRLKDGEDISDVVKEREGKLLKMMRFVMYGIVKEDR